jgi:hypothetical protein
MDVSVTGQDMFGSYSDAGVFVAVGLVNELAIDGRAGDGALDAIASLLEFDPPTHAQLRPRHVPGFVTLAEELHQVIGWMVHDDIDRAARRVNQWLAEHPATPHLAQHEGVWQLHHHPATADLVPMYTSICAEVIARLIGTGQAHRLGLCADPGCRRAYLDQSRNSSRRYCSVTCQNRAKTAAFRARQRSSQA